MPSSLHSSHDAAEIFLASLVTFLSSKMKFSFILEYISCSVSYLYKEACQQELLHQDRKEEIKVFKWSKCHVGCEVISLVRKMEVNLCTEAQLYLQ